MGTTVQPAPAPASQEAASAAMLPFFVESRFEVDNDVVQVHATAVAAMMVSFRRQ